MASTGYSLLFDISSKLMQESITKGIESNDINIWLGNESKKLIELANRTK